MSYFQVVPSSRHPRHDNRFQSNGSHNTCSVSTHPSMGVRGSLKFPRGLSNAPPGPCELTALLIMKQCLVVRIRPLTPRPRISWWWKTSPITCVLVTAHPDWITRYRLRRELMYYLQYECIETLKTRLLVRLPLRFRREFRVYQKPACFRWILAYIQPVSLSVKTGEKTIPKIWIYCEIPTIFSELLSLAQTQKFNIDENG